MKRVMPQSRRCYRRGFGKPRLTTAALNRFGATLSEILVSVLVMSIGVVSLATLFPISVLRSIQASQLTNATIHRLNAEELIGLFPRMVHNPNVDLTAAVDNTFAQHETQYNHPTITGLDNPPSDGVNEGRFIVDPTGWNALNNPVAPETPLLALRDHFGNNLGAVGVNPVRRYHGGFNDSLILPEGFRSWRAAYLRDSWQLISKGTPANPTATSIDVSANVDLATFNSAIGRFANGERARLILFSPNGKQSVVREHSPTTPLSIAGQTITWTGAIPFASISRFRLETFDTRYSWLLTVRKQPNFAAFGTGTASVDVVVFHKRTPSQANEQIYFAAPNLFLQNNNNRFTLDLAPATYGGTAPPKPFLKKGGFVFDAQHAHWYRIAHVTNETTDNPVITIDRPAVRTTARFMTLPGVVDVYPIPSVQFNANNRP